MLYRRIIALTLSVTLAIASLGGVEARWQDETRAKVAEAVNLLRTDRLLAVSRLRALGALAVPFLVEVLKSMDQPVVPVRLILLNFIAETKGGESDAALIELSSDSEPYIRGFAAVAPGERKVGAAIPNLVALLNDKEIYMSHVTTDPYREEHRLVRDAAIAALRSITGQNVARGKSQEEQAKSWQRWWRKQQK